MAGSDGGVDWLALCGGYRAALGAAPCLFVTWGSAKLAACYELRRDLPYPDVWDGEEDRWFCSNDIDDLEFGEVVNTARLTEWDDLNGGPPLSATV